MRTPNLVLALVAIVASSACGQPARESADSLERSPESPTTVIAAPRQTNLVEIDVAADVATLALRWAELAKLVGFEGDRTTTETPFDVQRLGLDPSVDGRVRGVIRGPGRIERRSALLQGVEQDPNSGPPVDLTFLIFDIEFTDTSLPREVAVSVALFDSGRADLEDLSARAEGLASAMPLGANVVVLLDSYEPLAGLDDLMSIRMMAVGTDRGVVALNPTLPTGQQALSVQSLDDLWKMFG
jgi:hypothetical protein